MKSSRANMNMQKKNDKAENALEKLTYAMDKSTLEVMKMRKQDLKGCWMFAYNNVIGLNTSMVLNNWTMFGVKREK